MGKKKVDVSKWAKGLKPEIIWWGGRPVLTLKTLGMFGEAHRPDGRSTAIITCPFCQYDQTIFLWSFAGHGSKRCDNCGVLITDRKFAYCDVDLIPNDRTYEVQADFTDNKPKFTLVEVKSDDTGE